MAKRPATTTKRSPALAQPRESVVALPEAPPVQAPIPLAQLLGQERAIAILTDALISERVHHAWIFHGPPGVGKLTAALAFAALLLDPTTEKTMMGELAPDPESKVQQLLRAGSHPDLAIITKELARYHEDAQVRSRKHTAISVEVVRQFILEPGQLAPQVSTPNARAGRVFIIDEAELLTLSAQNAILKFLEEPPQRTVLMLVASNPELLLPTIRSRCQRISFGTLSQQAMHRWTQARHRALEDAGVESDLTPAQASWLLAFSAGSPGTYENAKGLYAWWTRLEPMLTQAEKGTHVVELGATMAELTDAWAKTWVEDHDNASKEAANRTAADWMLRLLAWRIGTRSRAAMAKGQPVTSELAATDALHAAETELDANVSLQFVMEKLAAEYAAAFRGD
jgi:DNA polymerase III subunit delta'